MKLFSFLAEIFHAIVETIRRRPPRATYIRRDAGSEAGTSPFFQAGEESGSKSRNKGLYVQDRGRHLPPWLMPLLLSAAVLLLVFGLLPRLFAADPGEKGRLGQEEASYESPPLAVGAEAMVAVAEAPVYDGTSLDARRLTSALYGELLTVDELPNSSWAAIRLEDGVQGFMRQSDLSGDSSPHTDKTGRAFYLVLASEKRVMSHTMNGQVLMRAPMGTILPVDYEWQDVMRVVLPGGVRGWMNKSSLQALPASAEIAVPAEASRLFVSSAMNFYNALYVPGGLSQNGADMAGVIYIAARVNGVTLPRDLAGQMAAGEKVQPILDPQTQLPLPDPFQPGDVLFFDDGTAQKKVACAAIVIDQGKALCAFNNDAEINLQNLNGSHWMQHLLVVRRYFPGAKAAGGRPKP